MAVTLDYATVLTPTQTLTRSTVVASDDGRISYIGPMEDAPRVDGERLDLRGRFVIPGFINIHVHGGNGITFGNMDALEEDLENYSRWAAQNGVSGFLISIMAPTGDELTRMIEAYVPIFERGVSGAEALGIHLEGPFMNVEKKGAQNPKWIHDPDLEEAKGFLKAGQGWIHQVTIAPELPGAKEVAALFRQAGVVNAVAHSTAGYDIAREAFLGDWTHVTHTFNAQTGLHHRKPGLVGAVMNMDDITAELIADEIHVHPGAMKVLVRAIGTDRVVLITDGMEAAGLPEGDYHLLGHEISVRDGAARMADGTLAGSAAVLNQCVRNIHKDVDVSLIDAVKMATLNPARAMGFSNRLGSIALGKDASLTVIDKDVNVYLTMVQGRIVYNRL
jgi:N-acetylglucosamine-6-phosphate deacetylase